MIKTFVFCLFLTVVYCANVRRQVENDDDSSFIQYRDADEEEGYIDREWLRRREIELYNQRQRERQEQLRQRYIIQWLDGNYGLEQQQRYQWERDQLLRQRAEDEYEQYYEPESSVLPYYVPNPVWGGYVYV